jgi:flagellin
MTAAGIGVDSLDLSDNTNSEAAIETIDDAMMLVSVERGAIGASTIRLEHVINVNTINAENTQAAESRLRDVDMAREMMNFMKNSILMQSAQAMIAQANQFPNLILQLLR